MPVSDHNFRSMGTKRILSNVLHVSGYLFSCVLIFTLLYTPYSIPDVDSQKPASRIQETLAILNKPELLGSCSQGVPLAPDAEVVEHLYSECRLLKGNCQKPTKPKKNYWVEGDDCLYSQMPPRKILAFISAARAANVTHVIESGVKGGGTTVTYKRYFETFAVDMKFSSAVRAQLNRREVYTFQGDGSELVPLLINLIKKSGSKGGVRIALIIDGPAAVELWQKVKEDVWITMIDDVNPGTPQRELLDDILEKESTSMFYTDSACYRQALQRSDESLCEEQVQLYDTWHGQNLGAAYIAADHAAILLSSHVSSTTFGSRLNTATPISVAGIEERLTISQPLKAVTQEQAYAYFFSTRPVSVLQSSPVSKYALLNALRELMTSIFSLRKFTKDDIVVLVPESDDLFNISECLLALGAHVQRTNQDAREGKRGYDSRKLSVWSLKQYRKVLFLDSDTLILKSLSDVFSNYSELAAVEYLYRPPRINLGAFLLEPNSEYITELADETGPNDQDTFQVFFDKRGLLQRIPFWFMYDQQTFAHKGKPDETQFHGFHFKGMKPTMFGPWNGTMCIDRRIISGDHGWEDEEQCRFTERWVRIWEAEEDQMIQTHPECDFRSRPETRWI